MDRSFDPFEMGAKVAALGAALLPAGGFVSRAIAFQITFGGDWAVQLAWSAPLPQLAVTGLLSVLLVAPVPILLWVVWRAEVRREARMRRPPRPSTKPPNRRDLLVAVGMMVSGLVGMGAALILIPAFPSQLLSSPLGPLVLYGARYTWRRYGRPRLRDIWWVVVLVILFADVSGGILGFVPIFTKADYQFSPAVSSRMVNGSYQQVGEADGFVYLNKCGTNQIYVVNDQAIASAQQQHPAITTPPNLVQVLGGARVTLGLPLC